MIIAMKKINKMMPKRITEAEGCFRESNEKSQQKLAVESKT